MKAPVWFSAGLIAASVTTATATPQNAKHELNTAEQWVVAQVTAGQIADLSKQFPKEEDRKLSARFLEDLLTGTLPGVKLHRHGVEIIWAIIDEPIDLLNAQIPCDVRLDHCQFSAGGTFGSAKFAGRVLFNNSTFNKETNFFRVKVGEDAIFDHATFEGPVNFFGADIAGGFVATGAKVRETQVGANFQMMKARGGAFFMYAVFEGPVDFFRADIRGNFVADHVKFHSASFVSMRVGGDASFSDAVFEGNADFSLVNIASNFFGSAKFQKPTSFLGIRIRGDAHFIHAVFEGRVDFLRADIGNNLDAEEVKFQTALFDSMKVGGEASFSDAMFEEPVDFAYAELGRLDLSRSSWPKVNMQGMSYKYILAAPTEPESHKALLKLADQSAYSADVYGNLEEFFKRQGYRADADEAFVAGKWREQKEYFQRGNWFRWLGSWALYLLVGYGRRPWQAGIPCAALVALGCVLFSPKKMEPQRPEDTPRIYSRFWYSLGLFLPFVDLQADKVWKPKADQTFLRNYMRMHVLLGWILIPIVLAALTGLIK